MPLSVRTRTNMDIFKKGWFTEANSELWSGQAFSLEVKEILYHSKSTYQNILIFQWYYKICAMDIKLCFMICINALMWHNAVKLLAKC